MKIIVAILAIIIASVSSYSLITGEFVTLPYIQILLAAMLLFLGINELKEKRKTVAVFLFFAAAFSIFVNISILFS